jgi:hypothetical protein
VFICKHLSYCLQQLGCNLVLNSLPVSDNIKNILRRYLWVLSICRNSVELQSTQKNCVPESLWKDTDYAFNEYFLLLQNSRICYHGHKNLPLDYPRSTQSSLHPNGFHLQMPSTALRLYSIIGKWIKYKYWSTDGMILMGKLKCSEKTKPIPVPLCPPQITNGLAQHWTQTSARPATNRLSYGTAIILLKPSISHSN